MNEKQARNGPSWRPALEQIVLNMQRDTIVTKFSKFTAQKILETSQNPTFEKKLFGKFCLSGKVLCRNTGNETFQVRKMLFQAKNFLGSEGGTH